MTITHKIQFGLLFGRQHIGLRAATSFFLAPSITARGGGGAIFTSIRVSSAIKLAIHRRQPPRSNARSGSANASRNPENTAREFIKTP
jgi:hypothetical protein